MGLLSLPVFRNKVLARFVLKTALRSHNFLYNIISNLALVVEDGIHPKHRLMNYHAFFVDNINHGDAVLDIGCGNGFLSYDLSQKARTVIAIDLSKENIESAEKSFHKDNIRYICGDATKLDFNEKFNVVVLSNVLEHIADRYAFLAKIKPLAPKFLIRVPMLNRDWLTFYKKELGVEYRLDLTHQTEYTMERFQQELETAGMKIEKATVQFGEIWAVVSR